MTVRSQSTSIRSALLRAATASVPRSYTCRRCRCDTPSRLTVLSSSNEPDWISFAFFVFSACRLPWDPFSRLKLRPPRLGLFFQLLELLFFLGCAQHARGEIHDVANIESQSGFTLPAFDGRFGCRMDGV